MLFSITNKVDVPEPPRNKYEFVFELMHGDADKYEYESYFLEPNELNSVRTLLEEMEKAGWCDRNEQWNIPGFSEFFGEDLPRDVTNIDVVVRVSFREAFYYDGDGIKYNVKVER